MKLTLVRHSIPDYSNIKQEDSILLPTKAELSEDGIILANDNFKNFDFKGNEIILVSPFERTLETASILKSYIDIPITIENDLHEWLPDKTFTRKVSDIDSLYKDYLENKGTSEKQAIWETDKEIKQRVFNILKKYENYQNIIIVAHSRLFKVCFNLKSCKFASINQIEINNLEEFFNENY